MLIEPMYRGGGVQGNTEHYKPCELRRREPGGLYWHFMQLYGQIQVGVFLAPLELPVRLKEY